MIKVNYRALGMLSTNCYVVENPDSQKVLIVDPGDSPLEIERQIDEIDGDPEAILLTHGHFDHMLAADALRKKYHIPVYTYVYTMPWNRRIFGDDKNVSSEIAQYSEKILSNNAEKEKLKNWYTVEADRKPLNEGIRPRDSGGKNLWPDDLFL